MYVARALTSSIIAGLTSNCILKAHISRALAAILYYKKRILCLNSLISNVICRILVETLLCWKAALASIRLHKSVTRYLSHVCSYARQKCSILFVVMPQYQLTMGFKTAWLWQTPARPSLNIHAKLSSSKSLLFAASEKCARIGPGTHSTRRALSLPAHSGQPLPCASLPGPLL